jgi:hypothetical protein
LPTFGIKRRVKKTLELRRFAASRDFAVILKGAVANQLLLFLHQTPASVLPAPRLASGFRLSLATRFNVFTGVSLLRNFAIAPQFFVV